MPKLLRIFLGMLLGVMLIGGPISHAYNRQRHMRNFRVVRDGVLYRSGQMSLSGLKWAIHDYGITWWAPDGLLPAAEEGVRLFREVMDDPKNYPVLIHCFAGIHRTGAFCAIYRMEYENWTNAQAIAEMRACGYKDLEDEWDLLVYLEQYQPHSLAHTPQPPTSEKKD